MKNRCTKTILVFFLVNLFFSSGVWSFGQNPDSDDVVLSTPFLESFDPASINVDDPVLLRQWNVRDSLGGLMGWEDQNSTFFIMKKRREENCFLSISIGYRGAYLVSRPISVKPGKAYFGFSYSVGGMAGFEEETIFLYGKTPVPKEMDTLGKIEGFSTEWKHGFFEFESDGGPYYFSIHRANSLNGYYLDDIEIDTGSFVQHPIANANLKIPVSGCGLDQIALPFDLENMGTIPIYGFEVEYTVNGVAETFSFADTIGLREHKSFTIPGVQLERGKNLVGINMLQDIRTHYTCAKADIYNHEPMCPPHMMNLKRKEMQEMDDLQTGVSVWTFIDDYEVKSSMSSNSLRSSCFFLEEGENYQVSFLFKGGTNERERCRVILRIGRSETNAESWELLWDSVFYTNFYRDGKASFSVPEDGLYSFSFFPEIVPMSGVYLKEIAIEKENDTNLYDIHLESDSPILPASICSLDQAEISFEVRNWSTCSLNGFWAWYSVNGKDTIEQYFSGELEEKEIYRFSFDRIAVLDTGENVVKVGVEIAYDTNYQDNVSQDIYGIVYNHDPKKAPYEIDFTKGEMGLSMFEYVNGWVIRQQDNGEYFVDGTQETPLSSVCFDLDAGVEYRLEFDYMGGGIFAGGMMEYFDNLFVLIHHSGELWQSGKEIWRENEVLSYDWQNAETVFSVEESGLYSFAFGLDKTTRGGFSFKRVRVSPVLDYDVRMDFDSRIPRLIPLDQLGTPRSSIVDIRNMGKTAPVQSQVKADLNGQIVGMTVFEVNSSFRERFPLSLEKMQLGDTGFLSVSASVVGHESEDVNPDQEVNDYFIVTDSTMSYFESDSLGVGTGFSVASIGLNGPSGFSLPYTVSRDTLTSIYIGWADLPEGFNLPNAQLRIYPFNPISGKISGEAIYQSDIKRLRSGGWQSYDIPDMVLDGSFLFGVYQIDENILGLVFDKSMQGYHFVHYLLLNDSVKKEQEMGYPAIRLNFGRAERNYESKKDIAVKSFENPYSSTGAFSSEETVVVAVKNNGSDRLVGVRVRCKVNEVELESASIDLEPYLSGKAEFTADLSEPEAKYELTAWVEMDDDANPSNDTAVLELITVGALDPYVMDFEYCDDFSIDVLQGGWKTVDLDRSPNYGWQLVSFPHTYEAYGFMAFNPVKTQPSIAEDFGMYPYQGRRFGASFAATSGNAKDWLISPKLKMPEKGAKLSFYVKSFSKDYGYDQYKLFVSTTDDKILSFKQIGDLREAPDWEWQYVEQDLGEYAGQEIHVAIQRVQENGYGFVLMIDDIRISKPGASVQRTDISESLSLYPNPAKGKVRLMASLPMTRLQAYDLTGRMVLDRDLGTNCSEYEWDVSSWLPGLYFLNVQTPSGLGSLKLVVKE